MMSGFRPSLTVRAKTGAYPIFIENDRLNDAAKALLPSAHGRKAFIVTDMNVAPLYLETLVRSFEKEGVEALSFVVPAGEAAKSFSMLQRVVGFFLKNGADRMSFAVALGGGVVGDLTGFAASITLRGIDFFQIPTTLLAQVDSSVGGKTAVDTDEGKNLAGTFWQPKGVFIDTSVLKTLPPRQMKAGYAEVVKYALIADEDFWNRLCADDGAAVVGGDPAACRDVVKTCCAVKADVVAKDETETTGIRALLNFGHTFGHALEAESGFRLLHGEAVAAGMVLAADFSSRFCGLSETARADIVAHFKSVGLPVRPDAAYDVDALMRRMFSDKKTTAGLLNLVVLSRVGGAFVFRGADEAAVRNVWQNALSPVKKEKK